MRVDAVTPQGLKSASAVPMVANNYGGRTLFDLHAQNGAFPRGEQELRKVCGIEPRVNLAGSLSFGNAGCK